MSKQKYLVIAAVVVLAAGAGQAVASEPSSGAQRVIVQVRVPIADLDLSNPAAADVLLARVGAAAKRACRPSASGGVSQAEQARAQGICRRNAIAGAVAKVDSPVVQARYEASRPHKAPAQYAVDR